MRGRRQLRLALSMRGGVSLAVWIGGATQEVDRLRRGAASPSDATDPSSPELRFHRLLLDLANYDSVIIDVITGASAGGLNGVLLARAMLTHGDLERLRNLWIDLGDIGRLLRPAPPRGKTLSLFDGDNYFRPHLAEALEDVGKTATNEPRQHVQMIAAGTLRRAERVRIGEDESTRVDESRSDTYFQVARIGPSKLGLDGFAADDIVDQLALIGRASSAFPVAFEPAAIPLRVGQRLIDLSGRFAEPASEGHPVRVIDGGVLDNIPVARAIRAIASASANQPTERVLLFLHPDPSQGGEPDEDLDDALGVVGSLSGKRSESLLTDIEELRLHNARVSLRSDERKDVLRSWLAGAVPAKDESRLFRSGLDVESILRCLIDPGGELPWHPPNWPGFGRPIDHWDGGGLSELRVALRTLIDELNVQQGTQATTCPTMSVATLRPFEPARRMSRFLIGVARALEEHRLQTDADIGSTDVGALKQSIYDVQLLAELSAAYVIGLVPPLLSARSGGPATVALEIVGAMRGAFGDVIASPGLTAALGKAAAGTLIGGDDTDGDDSDGDDRHWRGSVFSLATWNREYFVHEPNGDPDCFLAAMWDELMRAATVLGETIEAEVPAAEISADPGFAVVRRLARQPAGRLPELFDSLDRCLARLEAQPLPGEQRIRFVRVAGSARSPFEGVMADGGELPDDVREDVPPLSRAQKLTGSQLFHFGAFLNARWRANDWMWGEMDCAVSIVDLLVSPNTLCAAGDAATVTARIRDLVVGEPPNGFAEKLSKWWAAAESVVTAEIDGVITGGTSDLRVTKRLLIARRQLEILIARLAQVNATPDETVDGRPPPNPDPSADPNELGRALDRYSGKRRSIVGDLGSTRFTRLGMRAGLVAWCTLVRPRHGVTRWVLGALKPIVLALVGTLLSTRRAVAAAAVVGVGLVETRVRGNGPWWALLATAIVTIGSFVIIELVVKVGNGLRLATLVPRVSAIAALVFGLVVAVDDWRPFTSRWWFAWVGVVLVVLLFSWMKWWAVLIATVIVAGSLWGVRALDAAHWGIWPFHRLWVAGVVSSVLLTVLVTLLPVVAKTRPGRLGGRRRVLERTGLA